MKALILFTFIFSSISLSAQAGLKLQALQTASFKFDTVDSIEHKNRIIKIEDLRDGFETIKGVKATDNLLILKKDNTNKREISINFRDGSKQSILEISIRQMKGGGDAGGG